MGAWYKKLKFKYIFVKKSVNISLVFVLTWVLIWSTSKRNKLNFCLFFSSGGEFVVVTDIVTPCNESNHEILYWCTEVTGLPVAVSYLPWPQLDPWKKNSYFLNLQDKHSTGCAGAVGTTRSVRNYVFVALTQPETTVWMQLPDSKSCTLSWA